MEDKPKKSKGAIITIVILILIIIGMGVYIAFDKNIIFKSSTNVEEKKEKTEKEEVKEEKEEHKILGLYEDNIANAGDKTYSFNNSTTMNVKIDSSKKVLK